MIAFYRLLLVFMNNLSHLELVVKHLEKILFSQHSTFHSPEMIPFSDLKKSYVCQTNIPFNDTSLNDRVLKFSRK